MDITEYKCTNCGKTYTLLGEDAMDTCKVCGSEVVVVPQIVYRCPNCGNEYTFFSGHKQDRCDNCGSFLTALPPKPVINANSFKRVVLLNALFYDQEKTKNIIACNLEVFQNGRNRFFSGERNLMNCPDHLITEFDLMPMKSGDYVAFIFKFRRKTDAPENAIKEFYMITKSEVEKIQILASDKRDLYKLVEGVELPNGFLKFNGKSLELDTADVTRIMNSFSSDIKNEFLRIPEEIDKAKREQERIRLEQERARREQERIRQEQEWFKQQQELMRQELEEKKRKVAILPQFLQNLKTAETNLEDAKKHKGLFGGKKVKEAELKVKELQDQIAHLEELKASITNIEPEKLGEPSTISDAFIVDDTGISGSDNEDEVEESGGLSFSFTIDQDGEDVPTIRCSKCKSEDTECVDLENDLYKCGSCGNEFIPQIYKVLGSPDEYIARGEQNFQERNFMRVIKDATAAIKLAPGNRKAYLLRGKAYGERGEFVDAEKDFTEALRISPDYDVAFYSRGNARLHMQMYDEAIEDLTASIGFDPDFAETYKLRAIGYFNKEDYAKAINDFSEAINRNPDDVEGLFQRGYSYLKIGEVDKAINDFNRTIELDSYNISAYYRRGEANEKNKNYPTSISDFTHFLELGGKNSDVANDTIERINRMRAELDPGDISTLKLEDIQIDENKGATREGMDLVEQLAHMGLGGQGEEKDDWVKTQKVFYLIGEGEKYFSEGKYKEANESFTSAINFNPAEPTTFIKRSFTSYKLGNLDQALSDLSLAISAEPYHSNLSFLRGAISLIAGKEDDALGDFVEGIHAQLEKDFDRHVFGKLIAENNQLGIAVRDFAKEIKPEGNEIYQYLTKGALAVIARNDVFFEETKDDEKPVAIFNRAIQLDPGCVSGYWCRGFVQQSTDKKVEDYSEAIRLRGNRAIYFLIRGTTKLLVSGIEGYKQDLSKTVELEPENTEAFEKIGLYYLHKEKKYGQAITVLSTGIGRNSKNPNLYYYRGLANEKQGDLESATSDFEKYIEFAENGGKFNVEKVRERIETIKTGGNPDSISESGENSLDLSKLLAGLGIETGEEDQSADGNEEEIEFVIENDEEDDNSSGISFTRNSEGNLIDEVTDENKENARAYFLKGYQEYINKNYESTVDNITRGLQLNPKDPEAYLSRAWAFKSLNNNDKALDDYTSYIHARPENLMPIVPLNILLIGIEIKDLTRPFDIFTEAIRYYPNVAELYFYRGQMHRIMENWDMALADLNKTIELDNDDSFYYLERAVIHEHKANHICALSDYQMIIELPKQKADDRLLSRVCYVDADNPNVEEKIPELLDWISHNDVLAEKAELRTEEKKMEFAKEHAVKAHQYQERSEIDKAVAEYQIAINLAPNFALPYAFLCKIYLDKQDMEKAFYYISEAVRINPNDPEALENRGTVYEKTGKVDEAIKDYCTAIQLNPASVSAYQNLGAAYLNKKEFSLAIEHLTKAIILGPNKPLPYAYRGYASYLNGDNKSAVADWKKYCALGGDSTYALSIEQIRLYIKALEEQG